MRQGYWRLGSRRCSARAGSRRTGGTSGSGLAAPVSTAAPSCPAPSATPGGGLGVSVASSTSPAHTSALLLGERQLPPSRTRPHVMRVRPPPYNEQEGYGCGMGMVAASRWEPSALAESAPRPPHQNWNAQKGHQALIQHILPPARAAHGGKDERRDRSMGEFGKGT